MTRLGTPGRSHTWLPSSQALSPRLLLSTSRSPILFLCAVRCNRKPHFNTSKNTGKPSAVNLSLTFIVRPHTSQSAGLSVEQPALLVAPHNKVNGRRRNLRPCGGCL